MTTETTANAASDNRSSNAADVTVGKITDQAQKALGSVHSAITDNGGPLLDRAKAFARERPYATAALAGVIGVALINTLRGRG